MKEEYLHYIWKYKNFTQKELKTESGEGLEIIDFGNHNKNAGPDFLNAKVKIGNTLWAGNIEIHINSSDWNNHGHQNDKAYSNVILHVVFNHDKVIKRNSGEIIETLSLKNRVNQSNFEIYSQFIKSKHGVPCQNLIGSVSPIILNSYFERLAIERIERKSIIIKTDLENSNYDWEQNFYKQFLKCFGMKVNSFPFEILAEKIPFKILKKESNDLKKIEAILFGQAGLISLNNTDEYPKTLLKEYEYQKNKYNLSPIENDIWKFSKLRPNNFPTVRIGQISKVIFNSNRLFDLVVDCNFEKIHSLLNITLNGYWKEHYVFDKISQKREKTIGIQLINSIIINAIVPFLFLYGKYKSEEKYITKAIDILEKIPGENNSITNTWKNIGIEAKNALKSQALIELKNEYCNHKKCLDCSIGINLLKKSIVA